MKKILSYIWPITRKFPSEFNGTLEISYVNGKRVLDTKNANYSYGSLQKILEIGLTKVNLKSVENLLLLGLGGGSIIQSLRETFEYQKNIIAVEIDPEIIKLAKDEFGISPSNTLQIVQADAFEYVKTSKNKFQLIIIDLFIDTTVPSKFFKKEFCDNVSKLISINGELVFNIGVNLEKDTEIASSIIDNFGIKFKFYSLKKVNGTNHLLIGKKIS